MSNVLQFPPANPSVLAQLVGLPYEPRGRTLAGVDCWGLVLVAARSLWGLQLPEYFYSEHELALLHEARELIAQAITGPEWHEVGPPYPRGAVHLFRIRGHVTHCGLHLDGQLFLHSLPGRNSCLEHLGDLNWRQRHAGAYLYE